MKKTINFLLAGVGGQGTILASDVLVNVGLSAGYQAKQAEVHGMSQRGGSVTSFVRWGEVVHSPLVGAGEVDVLLAFEKLEALRTLNQLRPGGVALINNQAIEPLTVISGDGIFPIMPSAQHSPPLRRRRSSWTARKSPKVWAIRALPMWSCSGRYRRFWNETSLRIRN
jgi:indolepyruvate ferredoxin oxidoreductase beta subunit